MRKFIITLVFLLQVFSAMLNAQQNFRVSGFVKDRSSRENLIGANVIQQGTTRGTMTDYNGYFSIPVNSPCSLTITFLGHKRALLTLDLRKDTIINVFLAPGIEELSEVTVRAARKDFNVTTLNISEMTKIPSLGGKPDVIKALQLMPGITTQSEGTSLMLVRGGDPGQNLYLFDNTPVIYVNHLGGFTSVFNPDIINNIDVYKGGFPSKYGGRLSSVMDITQKEGNASELKASYSIGITDASFTLEGPVKREKTSFIVTGRKTLIDPLMALMTWRSEANSFINSYGFHDINGKLTWKPKENSSYSLNIYQGDDYLNYWSKKDEKTLGSHHLNHTWGNLLVSLQHKSALSPRLYSASSLSLTRYRLRESMKYSFNDSDTAEFRWRYRSVVQDMSYKTSLKYNVSGNWLTELGLQVSYLRFKPNDTYYTTSTISQFPGVINSMENAFYMDNKISFLKNNWIAPGFRVVNYITKDYTGFSFEPRINITAAITPNHSINASFMKVSQFSHLIFTAGDIMKNEVWIPAGKKIAPAESEQYTIGWKGDYMKGKFSSEVNMYYKNMYNLSTFREGYSSLAGDYNWISKIESAGKGKSEGIEFLLKKNTGNWTGFASYAFSRSTRKYPNINKGQEYIFDYDRPHSFIISLEHKITNDLRFNIVWMYQTGLPYTSAVGRQYSPPLEANWNGYKYYYEALIYGERNGERMKDYHRLDIGLNWSTLTRKGGNRAEWNFSIYNAYNRHNPLYYYYNVNKSEDIYNPEHDVEFRPLSLYQMSFFPIIPSLSYKVYFGNNSNIDNSFSLSVPQNREETKILSSEEIKIPGLSFSLYGGVTSLKEIDNDIQFKIGNYYTKVSSLKAGVTYDLNNNESSRFFPSAGLSISGKGAKNNVPGSVWFGTNKSANTERFFSFDLPILFNYKFKKWLILKGGINPGLIFATHNFQKMFDVNLRPVSLDVLGGGYIKIRSFKLEAEYSYGISDILKYPKYDISYRNSALYFGIGKYF